MAAYNNFILTDQGIRLLGDLMNGNGELEFRCLAVGSGSYTAQNSIEEIRSMEELKEERQRVLFSSIETAEDGFVNLKVNLTNKDLEEGYPMTEAGIYAGKKGEQEEILYCVSTVDNPDYMPDYSSRQIYNVIFKMLISIGDVSSPTISYKTDVYALAEDLQSEKDRAEEAEDALKKDIASEAARASGAEEELQRRKLDVDGDASDVTVEFREAEELKPLKSLSRLSELLAAMSKVTSVLIAHLADTCRVDNTSDMEKPVSTAQQTALDALYAQLTAYADKAIADLINGAPSTRDTLGEIAAAMEENADVVSALNEAIGKKANAAEFDSHAKDTVRHVTAADRESWKTVAQTNSPSADADYRILFSGTADDTTRTEGARKSGSLTYDPHTKTLKGDGIELRSTENTDGRRTKISGDGMWMFMPEGGYSGGIGYVQDGKLVGVLGRWKENDAYYFFCGKNYDNPDGIFRAGMLEAGDKASLFTDNEGGNLRLVSPNGITWEIDAYNDNLRFFRYAEGSLVTGAGGFEITKDGMLNVPGGIAGIGYLGSTFGQLGYGAITYYGHVTAYGLSGTVILKIGGRVEERYSMSDTDFDLGINLSDILSRLGLNPYLNIADSQAAFFNGDGTFNTRIYGYGAFFSLRYVDGQKILTPARYYTADGAGGSWASTAEVYSPGTVWTAEVVLR